jgi:riboflavin kinase/FMN adenylyltransferase
MSRTAVIIGNFDGVHRGHEALVCEALLRVGEAGRVIALTFDPLPGHLFRPLEHPRRLCTSVRRTGLLKQCGVHEVVEKQIDREWLNQSPGEFIQNHILPLGPDMVVEGPDFRFGRDRAGDLEVLAQFGRDQPPEHRFDVHVLPPQRASLCNLEAVPARSSTVRWLLDRGRVRDAGHVLGRPYLIEGSVITGDQRGRTIGCPTANLDHGDLLLPADGVYAGCARTPHGQFSAAISIGTKPTFNQTPRVLEAHLIDWDGSSDDYGWHLEVELHRWVRDQVAFDSVDALKSQIDLDIAAARGLAVPGS